MSNGPMGNINNTVKNMLFGSAQTSSTQSVHVPASVHSGAGHKRTSSEMEGDDSSSEVKHQPGIVVRRDLFGRQEPKTLAATPSKLNPKTPSKDLRSWLSGDDRFFSTGISPTSVVTVEVLSSSVTPVKTATKRMKMPAKPIGLTSVASWFKPGEAQPSIVSASNNAKPKTTASLPVRPVAAEQVSARSRASPEPVVPVVKSAVTSVKSEPVTTGVASKVDTKVFLSFVKLETPSPMKAPSSASKSVRKATPSKSSGKTKSPSRKKNFTPQANKVTDYFRPNSSKKLDFNGSSMQKNLGAFEKSLIDEDDDVICISDDDDDVSSAVTVCDSNSVIRLSSNIPVKEPNKFAVAKEEVKCCRIFKSRCSTSADDVTQAVLCISLNDSVASTSACKHMGASSSGLEKPNSHLFTDKIKPQVGDSVEVSLLTPRKIVDPVVKDSAEKKRFLEEDIPMELSQSLLKVMENVDACFKTPRKTLPHAVPVSPEKKRFLDEDIPMELSQNLLKVADEMETLHQTPRKAATPANASAETPEQILFRSEELSSDLTANMLMVADVVEKVVRHETPSKPCPSDNKKQDTSVPANQALEISVPTSESAGDTDGVEIVFVSPSRTVVVVVLDSDDEEDEGRESTGKSRRRRGVETVVVPSVRSSVTHAVADTVVIEDDDPAETVAKRDEAVENRDPNSQDDQPPSKPHDQSKKRVKPVADITNTVATKKLRRNVHPAVRELFGGKTLVNYRAAAAMLANKGLSTAIDLVTPTRSDVCRMETGGVVDLTASTPVAYDSVDLISPDRQTNQESSSAKKQLTLPLPSKENSSSLVLPSKSIPLSISNRTSVALPPKSVPAATINPTCSVPRCKDSLAALVGKRLTFPSSQEAPCASGVDLCAGLLSPRKDGPRGLCTPLKDVPSSLSWSSTASNSSLCGTPRKTNISSAQLIHYTNQVMTECLENPARRLNVNLVPECARLDRCVHIERQEEVSDYHKDLAETAMRMRQWYLAVGSCSMYVTEKHYLPWTTLQHVIHNVLNTHDEQVLAASSLLLHKHLLLHPPCNPTMKALYTQLLTAPYRETLDGVNPASNQGLFDELLTRLAQLHGSEVDTDDDASGDEALPDAPAHCTITSLVRCTEAKQTYAHLPAATKLRRVCFLLDYALSVLEQDAVAWLMSRPTHHQPRHLMDLTRRPAVAALLWPRHAMRGVGTVNVKCREVIKLLHGTAGEANRLCARLVGLMAEVARVAEITTNATYPNIADKCIDLARELTNMMPSGGDVALTAVKLRPTWLGMLMVHQSTVRLIRTEDTTPSLDIVIACVNLLVEATGESAVAAAQSGEPTAQRIPDEKVAKRINKKDCKGETRLHLVCRRNKHRELETLLSHPEIDVNVSDNASYTPLHEAAFYGNVQCVELLLAHEPTTSGGRRVDVQARDREGNTPLMEAVTRGEADVCRLLLKHAGWCLLEDRRGDGKCAANLASTEEIKRILKDARATKYNNLCSIRKLSCANMSRDTLDAIARLIPVYVRLYLDTYKINAVSLKTRKREAVSDAPQSSKKFNYMHVFYAMKSLRNLKLANVTAYKETAARPYVSDLYHMLTSN